MEPIQFSGISDMSDEEKDTLKEAASKHYDKLKQFLKDEQTSVTIHIKTYKEKEDKKKYSVTLNAMTPTNRFRSGTTSWILANAVTEAFDKVIHEVRAHFKL